MTRFFRYSSLNYNNLKANSAHEFARRHALNIYRSDAIYSFIPKNACSTLRVSIAFANGCIDNVQDFNWIHKNNDTFSANLPELVKANYTFTILRCPFSRLASAYLDKIVSKTPVGWQFVDLLDRKITLDHVTFSEFVKGLKKPQVLSGDIHWRPQVDFLVYKTYDDYYSLHDFDRFKNAIFDKIGLRIIDARELTKHGTDRLILLENACHADTLPHEIAEMKNQGFCPSLKSLYNAELIELVAKLYATDLAFYKDVIGAESVMFS